MSKDILSEPPHPHHRAHTSGLPIINTHNSKFSAAERYSKSSENNYMRNESHVCTFQNLKLGSQHFDSRSVITAFWMSMLEVVFL